MFFDFVGVYVQDKKKICLKKGVTFATPLGKNYSKHKFFSITYL